MGKQRSVREPGPKVEAGRAVERGWKLDRAPDRARPEHTVGSCPGSGLGVRRPIAHDRSCPRSSGHEAFSGEAIVGGDYGAARNRQRLSQLPSWREMFAWAQLPGAD